MTTRPVVIRTLSALTVCSASVIGFAQSLYLTYKLYIPYPDCINGVLIYLDLKREGLQAVSQWILNADNFIFNLHWISWIWFAFFGTSVLSLTTFSAGIFLLCVVGAALIVLRITSNRRQAAVAVALLFPIANNLINTGQSHPVAHGITMIYVLASVIITLDLLTSLNGARWRWSALVLMTAACTISDPWFDAAFAAPAVLALGVLTVVCRQRDDWSAARAVTVAAAVVVGVVFGQGVYWILVHYQLITEQVTLFASVSVMSTNLQLLSQVLPTLFNYDTTQTPGGLGWVFIASGILLLGILVRHTPLTWQRTATPARFVMVFGLLSCLIMVFAFVVTGYATSSGLSSARYLLNIYYLAFVIGIVIAGEAWASLGGERLVVVCWLVLFCVPGVVQLTQTFRQIGFQHASLEAHREVVAWLEQEGLHDGFAPYFSGQVGANSLTYISDYRLAVRPLEIVGGRLRPFAANVNRGWFGDGASGNFFAVHASDESTFQPAAIASFGAPQKTVRHGDYVVWIWPGNLITNLATP